MVLRKKSMAEEIEDLKVIIENRKNRVLGLTKLVKKGLPKNDLLWISKEIKEHEKWINDTEKLIKKFYAPKEEKVS